MRNAHIPVTWKDSGHTLRCHPRFREYLQDRLEGWGEERLRSLRVAHGRLLASEGHHEEATEVLLGAGAAAEALEPAATAIFDVINRLDFGLAERWLGRTGRRRAGRHVTVCHGPADTRDSKRELPALR